VTYALAEFVFVVALTVAVGSLFYTVGRHFGDIRNALFRRPMR
jgi:hypothetical protein